MSESSIFFIDPSGEPTARVTQLYQDLELYADGEPSRNTLFVLGKALAADLSTLLSDQLLLIDPPPNAQSIFQLNGDVAVLFTDDADETADIGLPRVQTRDNGLAHLRIGDHFLDIYTQHLKSVVQFPALGILCSGDFGSDLMLPLIAETSDGGKELETLRLLASLLKQQHFQLFIPRFGTLCEDRVRVMERLASDVGYLNGLRRLIPQAVQQGEAIESIEVAAQALLPYERDTPACRAVHDANVERLCENSR